MWKNYIKIIIRLFPKNYWFVLKFYLPKNNIQFCQLALFFPIFFNQKVVHIQKDSTEGRRKGGKSIYGLEKNDAPAITFDCSSQSEYLTTRHKRIAKAVRQDRSKTFFSFTGWCFSLFPTYTSSAYDNTQARVRSQKREKKKKYRIEEIERAMTG